MRGEIINPDEIANRILSAHGGGSGVLALAGRSFPSAPDPQTFEPLAWACTGRRRLFDTHRLSGGLIAQLIDALHHI